ncbi:MAG: Hsp70 family protein, partial [Gammaproteobacteria bacterium]
GEDFLQVLADYYFETTGIAKKSLTPIERQRVYELLEAAKRKLSSDGEVVIAKAVKAQDRPFTIGRDRFDRIVQPLLQRVQLPIERTLRDADVEPGEIEKVVLVGGATRMFAFRSLIARMFRRMPSGNIDPDLVVAMGAGLQAGLKQKHADLDDVVLTDVCPYTLGVEVVNYSDTTGEQGGLFMPVIERNSVVPISVERTFCTVKDYQTELKVNVYQGESRLVKNNVYLGALNVDVPRAKAGVETLNIRYSYDMNSLLEVDVKIDSTGWTYHAAIDNSPGNLSETEIQKSKTKLARLKFHPRDQAENRALIARAEHLFECALGEQRDYIGNFLSQFERVLERQNPIEIQKAASQFNRILDDLENDSLFT